MNRQKNYDDDEDDDLDWMSGSQSIIMSNYEDDFGDLFSNDEDDGEELEDEDENDIWDDLDYLLMDEDENEDFDD